MCECVRGDVELRVAFQPAPRLRAPGRVPIRATPQPRLPDRGRAAALHAARAIARSPRSPTSDVDGRFPLRAGERATFSLTFDDAGAGGAAAARRRAPRSLQRTLAWWRRWAARCTYDGPYREAGRAQRARAQAARLRAVGGDRRGADDVAARARSAATSTGTTASAGCATPRSRCALSDLGYEDEASAFFDWLLHSTRLTRPELRVLYDVYGGVPEDEATLDHLRGLPGSRPVRVGNAAAGQLQLDGYGEVVEAVAEMCRRGRSLDARDADDAARARASSCATTGESPTRASGSRASRPARHTHSRVLCWVALDRLLQLHRAGCIQRHPRRAASRRERDAIRAEIEREGFNATLGSYTDVLGGDTVDASLLLLTGTAFSEAERRAHARHATADHASGCARRRASSTATRPACPRRGRVRDLQLLGGRAPGRGRRRARRGGGDGFAPFLGYANDLGLFAEEIDPGDRRGARQLPAGLHATSA